MTDLVRQSVEIVVLEYMHMGLSALADFTDFMNSMPDEVLNPDIDTLTSDKVARAYCPIRNNQHFSDPIYKQTLYLEHLRNDMVVICDAYNRIEDGANRYTQNKCIIVSLFSIVDSCERLFESVLNLGAFEKNRTEPAVPIIGAMTVECVRTVRRYKEKFFALRNNNPHLRELRNKIAAHSDSDTPLLEARKMRTDLAEIDFSPQIDFITRLYNYLYFLPIHAWKSVDNDGRSRLTFQNGAIAGRILVRYPVCDPDKLSGPDMISIHKISKNEMDKTNLTDKQKEEIIRCWADPCPEGQGRYLPIQKLAQVARDRAK
jgi:hypothetical protein